ncbi:cytochrome-c oxidase, cbb3-type subunit I [uncultured Sunxiuqinia sp.]|jgi:cytochrome c oxidase cbb3-type subunit I/II|uniref:cytochrome-c oxidase, cbb3-type subunit I n=1 Tax=uncultured Sunxiuqinia sp. TaxID=1573825 RepID=UPI0030D88EA5|tara:strand:+ start:40828 stop:42978 length:2151 start_codon:yes stop_codon:yes gene_type:complete
MELQKFTYDNRITRDFAVATIVWGVVGMLVGLLVALQIFIPEMNFNLEYTTFGRTRPVHTNAVIFAFVGNAIFTAVYYSLPRLLKTSMYSRLLGKIHFWGWQLIIVAGAITLLMGYTSGKEYAELEWPIDIAITLVWVVFGINMFGTILQRRVSHIYVAIWFYIATWVTVAVLHIVNSIEIPYSLMKSYPVYAGIQDALVQWWYGHNAVAFFLTTPFLGLMYYFVPKAANRPIYSYKLSIVHFWSLIFIYIWAGPHHLLYSSLPDWLQALGTTFSIMLIAPSWGGMINGLLTLRGAWDKVRKDPVLKMFVVGITAYGMATFEGPMMSLKTVNAISHFTDWTVGHVHIGALGWNGMLTFGMLYWLVPRLYNTKLYSVKLANAHFWISTLAIIFYAVPLYIGGITQALMWKEFTPEGFLAYPNFLETVTQLIPMYATRAFGGFLYVVGMLMLVFNVIKTAKQGQLVAVEEVEAPALHAQPAVKTKSESWHGFLERKPIRFLIFATIAILIGGVFEIIPTYLINSNVPIISSVQPYTPLELQGRDIYVREGCYNCHSQMIRPFRSETERYGEYSKAGEFIYDHPFQFGSKRTGPDLAREGVKTGRLYKPNAWHYNHFIDPQKMNEGSIMPKYPWLAEKDIDLKSTAPKIRAMKRLGVPYPDNYEHKANDDLQKQAEEIAQNLREAGIETESTKEIIALIAYMQRLGTDIMKPQIEEEEE